MTGIDSVKTASGKDGQARSASLRTIMMSTLRSDL